MFWATFLIRLLDPLSQLGVQDQYLNLAFRATFLIKGSGPLSPLGIQNHFLN